MKVAGIPIYSSRYNKYCRNNISAKNDNPYQNKQTTDCNMNNIAFMAVDVKFLNPKPFYERNIISQGANLSEFLERIFGKIYKDDNIANVTKYHKILSRLSNFADSNCLVVASDIKTANMQPENLSEYIDILIHKGTSYHKQTLEHLNIIRSTIRDILIQYGFNPEAQFEYNYKKGITVVQERFNELLEDSSVKKEFIKTNTMHRDVLVLPDKYNTGTVIKFARDIINHQERADENLEFQSFNVLQYKDSENCCNLVDGFSEITAKDGTLLNFKYLMPSVIMESGSQMLRCLKFNNEINSLLSRDFSFKFNQLFFNDIFYNHKKIDRNDLCQLQSEADNSFCDIKDYEHGVIYTYKINNNDTEDLVGISDLKNGIMIIMNDAKKLVEDGKIALGTSLYTNLFQEGKPMGACVVLPYDIRKTQGVIKRELEPHILNGVGTGFDLSNTDEPTKVLKSLNELLKEYDTKTQRPPAGIAILDVTHKDILSFINAKRDADFNDWRFNISVSVPNDFMQKAANDETIQLTNGKEVKARSIYNAIINSMHYCGEPGIVFKDNVEAANPVPNHKYKGMASCAEIGLENGEMCLFSHLNLSKFIYRRNFIDYEALGEATEVLSRLLDNVIDINLAEKVGEDNIASQKRRFGIGVCGYADLLAKMQIPYGSEVSQDILAKCLETINFASKKASMELAKEKGRFPLFNESRYNERDFLIKHIEGNWTWPIEESEWNELYNDIQKYGLRNATTTALPPTGSSSRIVGASYSIEPYFDLRHNKIFLEKINELTSISPEQKQQAIDTVNKTGSCQNIEFLPQWFKDIFRLGNEISYEEHLKIVGTAQKFVDDGISKTINFENSATPEDIDKAVKMAYDLKLKGIAVFRDGCLAERGSK